MPAAAARTPAGGGSASRAVGAGAGDHDVDDVHVDLGDGQAGVPAQVVGDLCADLTGHLTDHGAVIDGDVARCAPAWRNASSVTPARPSTTRSCPWTSNCAPRAVALPGAGSAEEVRGPEQLRGQVGERAVQVGGGELPGRLQRLGLGHATADYQRGSVSPGGDRPRPSAPSTAAPARRLRRRSGAPPDRGETRGRGVVGGKASSTPVIAQGRRTGADAPCTRGLWLVPRNRGVCTGEPRPEESRTVRPLSCDVGVVPDGARRPRPGGRRERRA